MGCFKSGQRKLEILAYKKFDCFAMYEVIAIDREGFSMTKKTSRKLGLLLLVLAVCFVVYAMGHPTGSFPWSNSVTYGMYLVYLLLTAVLLWAPFGKK